MNYELLDFLEGEALYQSFQGSLNESESPYDLTGLKIQYPISYDLTIYKVDNGLEVDIVVDYAIETNCSRCLIPVLEDVHDSSHVKVVRGEVTEDTTGEEVISVEQYTDFPLNELIFSQVITSVPMKSLCKDDCKGLCPSCGQDNNLVSCQCNDESYNDQFEVLKGLFKENKEV